MLLMVYWVEVIDLGRTKFKIQILLKLLQLLSLQIPDLDTGSTLCIIL